MSTRRQAAIGGENAKNPATKFLNWKSNDQQFSYYDKEKAENVSVPLPFKFLFLDQLQSVKGWSDALTGSIISNEVKTVSDQELNVVCYHKNLKGESTKTTIAKGLYSNIKDAVVSAGAKYHKSIYIMLEDGTLANIQLKGASVKEWGDFFNKNKSRLADEWVEVASAKEDKKGAVKFWTPIFKFKNSLTEVECKMADETFDVLDNYLQVYLKSKSINNIEVEEPEIMETPENVNDDLAF